MEKFDTKMRYFIDHYRSTKWELKEINSSPRFFVEDMGSYLKETLGDIARVNKTIAITMAYYAFKSINAQIMDFL